MRDASTNNEDSNIARLVEYLDVFKENKLDIITMQEARIVGQTSCDLNEYKSFFSGGSKRNNGVAIVISKRFIPFLLEIHEINERMMWLAIKVVDKIIIIISAYGPTTEDFLKKKNEETKYPEFINRLDLMIKKLKADYPHAILLIGGDFNARVESRQLNDDLIDEVIQDLVRDKLNPEINNSGDHLLNFCITHNLAVVNLYYHYEKNGTGTWHSRPGKVGEFKCTIDHILLDNIKMKCLVIEGGV